MFRNLKNKVGKKGSTGEGVKCQRCGSNHLGVVDTTYHNDAIRRWRKCLNCDNRFATLEVTLDQMPDHAGSTMSISLRHLSSVLARAQHVVSEQLGKIDATFTTSSRSTSGEGDNEAHRGKRAGVASLVQTAHLDGRSPPSDA